MIEKLSTWYAVNLENGNLSVLLILLGIIALYFLPTLIACVRSHRNKIPVFVLNLFLGFYGIGWIVALIWSFSYQPHLSKSGSIYKTDRDTDFIL